MYNKIRHIHLIGVGGIGMSGLAQLLVQNGFHVTGSDLGRGDSVRMLENLGVKVFQGHDPLHVQGAELVVYSSAVQAENPELATARKQDILCITRGEMLAELMRHRHGIAVAGAHGKTTTTSMVGVVLVQAGRDPTVVVGGRVDNFGGTNARLGKGDFMVVEADESDGSFNRLSPSIAVITNLDREHLDHYGSMEQLEKAFVTFANKVPFYGVTLYCGDDAYLKRLAGSITRRKRSYGFEGQNAYQITSYVPTSEGSQFTVRVGQDSVSLSLKVPGRHNALNAVAALAVADELGILRSTTAEALASYRGVARRFQLRGEKQGVHFYDDYAHHPTEIGATLAAARERFPESRIRVIFQPHRFSRFSDLWDGFAACFDQCDGVAVTDVYAAGETPIPGVHSDRFSEELAQRRPIPVHKIQSALEGVELWLGESKPGDVVLTLGAGDLPNVYQKLF